MGELDSAFIQDIEHRPNLKSTEPVGDGIPTIDLSALTIADTQKLASEIGLACQEWGFFQIINHGVPLKLQRKVEKVAKEFFELPSEEKRKVKRNEVNPLGYYDCEHTKNVRDWKELFDFLVKDGIVIPASPEPDDKGVRTITNQWPQYPPEFREVFQEYAKQVEKLAFKLLELIALSLGLPENRFSGYFNGHTTSIRINYYPPCPFPHLALGVGRHKDPGVLTILAQDDVAGLQVKRKSDGEWITVKPTPNAYIVNVGDVFQVWSNEKYQSVEHRVVVNTVKERMSIPFFFHPGTHVMVKPVEELLNGENRPKYKEYNWGKFFVNRSRSDFKKLEVENVQIEHLRL
ncbi:protein DMR6-LIKE OXYGENASE 1 [Ziziphus jujuba]|uniref:Protein DMR6-LIKE OXYGENASE 1 n=1 Tax=Ziziphus jujuba TaxID=326968 RepID=A0ABM3IXS2_ZIZJJ|nr:protein DMR6-LIKE OXYGENASE 1 [Ziziphus jujuba]